MQHILSWDSYDKNIQETEGDQIHYRVKQDITQTLNQFHNHNQDIWGCTKEGENMTKDIIFSCW